MAIADTAYSDLEIVARKAEGFVKRIRKFCRKAQRSGCETLADAATRTLAVAEAAEISLGEAIGEAETADDVTEWLLDDLGVGYTLLLNLDEPAGEGFREAAAACMASEIWLRFVSDGTSDLKTASDQLADRIAEALSEALAEKETSDVFAETVGSIVRGDSFAAIHAGVAAQAGFAETAHLLPEKTTEQQNNRTTEQQNNRESEISRQESLIAADTRIADAGTDLPDYESAIRYIADKAEELSVTEGGRRKKSGDMWERMVVEFLRTDPVYRNKFAKVHLWSEYSDKRDIGIDIVAETFDGKKIAIQCKFSGDPNASLSKRAIDSFIATTDTKEWSGRYVFWSGFRMSPNVVEQIDEDRQVPLTMISGAKLRTTNTSWSELATTGKGSFKPLKKARDYQSKAVTDLEEKLRAGDRSHLIMACGSGKTYTSQLAAEQIAGVGGTVLYVVPSIALMGQTMREWAEQEDLEGRGIKHSFLGVCSDSGAGKQVKDDGIGGMHKTDIAQLEMPVGTDAKEIAAMLKVPVSAGYMRTVFSTYQSLPKILEAQSKHGAPGFKLMVCDEAHRTTGISAADETSHFHLAHNHIKAAQRVYMTATPKIFSEAAKGKAAKQGKAIYTMGDKDVYGEEAYKLSFSEAIGKHVLADYKVHIIQVAESVSQSILNQMSSADGIEEVKTSERNAMLKTDVAARLVGMWQAVTGAEGIKTGTLWKNIVYLDTIANSKAFAAVFPVMCDYLASMSGLSLPPVKVAHVDGTMSATRRQHLLSWLDEANIQGEIRILSNAKCLSEGVDVPSLDGVGFLVPKGSIIDIVQSVGRVIRSSPQKEYGHVILPAVLPTEIKQGIDSHLKKDVYWQTIWQVLRALRSHDDRFANELAVMELHDSEWPERMILSVTDDSTGLEGFCFAGGGDGTPGRSTASVTPGTSPDPSSSEHGSSGGDSREHGSPDDSSSAAAKWLASGGKTPTPSTASGEAAVTQTSLNFAEMLKTYPDEVLKMLQENITVATLEKVGDRQYWDTWGKDAAESYQHVLGRLQSYKENNPEFAGEVKQTTAGLAATLGALGSEDKTISILAQYIIVKPVFEALFGTAEHFDDSPLSVTMKNLAETIEILELENETAALEDFYKHVAEKAAMVTSPQDKQVLIKKLYEDFIHTVFPKEAKDFGVVYTPNEIVDFTLRSVDWAIKEHLGIEDGIADESVEVLDPFSGTGTFLVNLVQNKDLIPADKLAHKFANNLHTSEVMALPYWATELNLEQAYMARTGGEYLPYENGVLADTFSMGQTQMAEQRAQQAMRFEAMNENITRADQQDRTPITCIVGNPPWAMGKTGDWKELQDRIAETYSKKADTTLKSSLRDSYILALRWASDRIGDRGVIGFVTNNSWLSSNAGAGVRRTFEGEFDHIYVLDMLGKGGAATTPEQRTVQGGNLFGVTVGNSVVVLVRTGAERTEKANAVYADMKGLSVEGKTSKIVETKHIGDTAAGLEWNEVQSDYRGDWINQGHPDWRALTPIGDSATKSEKDKSSIVQLYTRGLGTDMGAHSIGSTLADVLDRGNMLADEYNEMIVSGVSPSQTTASGANWYKALRERLEKEQLKDRTEDVVFASVDESNIIRTMASPWLPQYALYHKTFNSRQSRVHDVNDKDGKNVLIYTNGRGSPTGVQAMAAKLPPDASCLAGTQAFARYRLDPAGSAIEVSVGNGELHGTQASDGRVYVDNILDEFLTAFRNNYSDESIVKDDIFFYMYGMLHHPGYRDKYGNDLTKDLPRMPYAPDFWGFSNAGKQLADIHANYDSLDGWDGDMDVEFSDDFDPDDRSHWYVTSAKFEDNGATLVLNDRIAIRNIPAGAHTYKIAGKSPIQQFASDTKRKVDKRTEIVNDVNDLYNDNPAETLLRARQLIEVGVRSSEVLAGLPEEFE